MNDSGLYSLSLLVQLAQRGQTWSPSSPWFQNLFFHNLIQVLVKDFSKRNPRVKSERPSIGRLADFVY